MEDPGLQKKVLKDYENKIDQLIINSEIRVESNSFDVSKIDKEMAMIQRDLEENKIVRKRTKTHNMFLNSPEREKINSILKSPNHE